MTLRAVSAAIQLTTAVQTIYTAPDDCSSARIVFGVCANVDASDRTITLNVVPSGGSVGSTNEYMKTVNIVTKTFNTLYAITGMILEPGDFIAAVASANSALNIRLGVMETVA